MANIRWTINVKQGLAASFKSDSGASNQGVLWAVHLLAPNREHHIFVKAIFSGDMTPDARFSYDQQACMVTKYIENLLANDWDPADEMEHNICLSAI